MGPGGEGPSSCPRLAASGFRRFTFDATVGSVAVWPRRGRVEYRTRPPGGEWTPAQAIPGQAEFTEVAAVMVATDGRGSVTVAWTRTRGFERIQVVCATRSPAGAWSRMKVLWETPYWDSAGEETTLKDPHLAVGADGSAVVAWSADAFTDRGDEERSLIEAWVAYRPVAGDWQRARRIGARDDTIDEIGIDPRGVMTAVVAGRSGLRTVVRSSTGQWRDGEILDTGNSGGADLSLAPDGAAALVFGRSRASWGEVRASNLEAGAWTRSVRLAPSESPPRSDFTYFENPQAAIQSGTTTVVYAPWRGPVRVVTRPRAGAFGPPRRLSAPAEPGDQLGVLGVWANQAGQALAVWGRRGNEGGWIPQAAYRARDGGAWSSPKQFTDGSTTAEDPIKPYSDVSAVVAPSGSCLVVWSDGSRVRARELGPPT